MNRYKFWEKDIPKVKAYLKKGTTEGVPKWAVKFKDKLSVKGNNIMYEGKQVVPKETVNNFLRKRLYSTDGDLPFGRDSAHYKLLQQTVGISRRVLMEFIRAQKTIQESKPSLAKPKRKPGKKLSKLQLETDLIFVRKDDLARSNPKFGDDETLKKETYIITTVEAASGLTCLDYLVSKDKTNDALERHIRWFAKKYKVKPSAFAIRSDKGSEYSMVRIKKMCPDYKFVPSATTCERKNRQVQSNFFRLLKNRQATTIKDALAKTQLMCNNTVSRKQKKTPSEIVEQAPKKQIIRNHNVSRKEYIKGDNRGEFEVGQLVRVLAPEKVRTGIDYKTYKGVTFEKTIRKIIKTTTKRAKLKKYRLDNQIWYTQDKLMKANPTDKESQDLIAARDEVEKQALAEHRKKLLKDVKQKEEIQDQMAAITPGLRRSRRGASKMLQKLKAQREAAKKVDQLLMDDQKEFEHEQKSGGKDKYKRKDAKLVAEFKQLAMWASAQEKKYPTYEGLPNAAELLKKWNETMKRGRVIAKQLKQKKVKIAGFPLTFFK